MTKAYNLIVVIPVGPNEVLDCVLDTIDSITRYTEPERKIIVLDNTGKNVCNALQSQVPDLDVVEAPRNPRWHGGFGGLYMTLSRGYSHAYKNYDFKVLLKMDTDALVIGERPEEDAINFFAERPDTGIIGHYRYKTHPDVDDGHWSKEYLIQETRRKSLLRDPILSLSLRRLLRQARANGFRMGDYVLGGSYFMSAECVRRLAEANLLLRKELGRSLLGEDHIFGLLAKAVGLELADFTTGEFPMAMELNDLPCAPEELVAGKKKVVHSVRRWEDLGEKEIRKYFREIRNASAEAQAN